MATAALHAALAQIPARAIMASPVLTAYERWPLSRLIAFFSRHRITGAPVIASDGRLVGVVSVTDVQRQQRGRGNSNHPDTPSPGYRLGHEELPRLLHGLDADCSVGQIMTPSLLQVSAETSLLDVMRLLHERGIHRVFVVQGARLVGVISRSALLPALLGEAQPAQAQVAPGEEAALG